MKVTFLGHAALLVEDDQFKALIDPFLKGNPSYIPNPNDIQGITHIFITHGHGDHVGDAIDIALNNNSLIISNAELASIFRRKNPALRVHPMHIGGTFTFDFGKVKMTPALHGSAFHDDGKTEDGGNPGGFVLTLRGKKLYHSGDTGLTMDMKLLELENIDIAFLPIGGNYTMDIDDAVRAVDFIKPKIVVPMHYNTFPLIKADPIEFKNRLSHYEVYILKSGESITI